MDVFVLLARFPSGQRGRTVNPLAQPSQVRILLSPPVNVAARTKVIAEITVTVAIKATTAINANAGIAQLVERQPSKL